MNDPIGDDLKIRGLAPDRGPEPVDGAEGAASTDASAAVDGAAAVGGAEVSDPAAIADALASGAIDAQTARAQLIDAAVASQLPADASPALAASVRAEVEAMLAGNPTLEALLRPS
jgi:hypothetical protein